MMQQPIVPTFLLDQPKIILIDVDCLSLINEPKILSSQFNQNTDTQLNQQFIQSSDTKAKIFQESHQYNNQDHINKRQINFIEEAQNILPQKNEDIKENQKLLIFELNPDITMQHQQLDDIKIDIELTTKKDDKLIPNKETILPQENKEQINLTEEVQNILPQKNEEIKEKQQLLLFELNPDTTMQHQQLDDIKIDIKLATKKDDELISNKKNILPQENEDIKENQKLFISELNSDTVMQYQQLDDIKIDIELITKKDDELTPNKEDRIYQFQRNQKLPIKKFKTLRRIRKQENQITIKEKNNVLNYNHRKTQKFFEKRKKINASDLYYERITASNCTYHLLITLLPYYNQLQRIIKQKQIQLNEQIIKDMKRETQEEYQILAELVSHTMESSTQNNFNSQLIILKDTDQRECARNDKIQEINLKLRLKTQKFENVHKRILSGKLSRQKIEKTEIVQKRFKVKDQTQKFDQRLKKLRLSKKGFQVKDQIKDPLKMKPLIGIQKKEHTRLQLKQKSIILIIILRKLILKFEDQII